MQYTNQAPLLGVLKFNKVLPDSLEQQKAQLAQKLVDEGTPYKTNFAVSSSRLNLLNPYNSMPVEDISSTLGSFTIGV